MHTKTARARGKVRAQYRWAYATSTLIPLQENGKNQHEKGGWAFNTSWAYNTYSTVLLISLNSGPFFQSDATTVAKDALPSLRKRPRLPKQHFLTPQSHLVLLLNNIPLSTDSDLTRLIAEHAHSIPTITK